MGRRGYAKEAEELVRLCSKHPAVDRVERKAKHWMVFPKDKDMPPVRIHTTPSSHRFRENTLAALRRSGIDLKGGRP